MRPARSPIRCKARGSRSTAGPSRLTERSGEAALSRPPPRGRLLCRLSRISPSGGSRSRAPIISAASAASSILTPGELLFRSTAPSALVEAEPGIVEHMNEDHADALELYATALAGARPGPWRMVGIDPEGFDSCLRARRGASCSPSRSPRPRSRARSWSGSPPRPAPAGNSLIGRRLDQSLP